MPPPRGPGPLRGTAGARHLRDVPPPAAPEEGEGPRDILVDAPAAVAKGLICCVIQ